MNKACSIYDLLVALTENMEDYEILTADITSSISNEIAKRRMSMNLSQKELAARLGKTQSTISKWENGDMNFTIELLAEIACKLDMRLSVEMKPQEIVQTSGDFKGISSGNVVDFEAIRSYSGDSRYLTVAKEM